MLTFDTGDAHALSRDEVKQGLEAGEIALVDVRDEADFAQARIPGSISHPLSRFDPAGLPQDGRLIVFTCSAGVRSMHAAHEAQAAGVSNVVHYQGGIEDWTMSGEPVETG